METLLSSFYTCQPPSIAIEVNDEYFDRLADQDLSGMAQQKAFEAVGELIRQNGLIQEIIDRSIKLDDSLLSKETKRIAAEVKAAKPPKEKKEKKKKKKEEESVLVEERIVEEPPVVLESIADVEKTPQTPKGRDAWTKNAVGEFTAPKSNSRWNPNVKIIHGLIPDETKEKIFLKGVETFKKSGLFFLDKKDSNQPELALAVVHQMYFRCLHILCCTNFKNKGVIQMGASMLGNPLTIIDNPTRFRNKQIVVGETEAFNNHALLDSAFIGQILDCQKVVYRHLPMMRCAAYELCANSFNMEILQAYGEARRLTHSLGIKMIDMSGEEMSRTRTYLANPVKMRSNVLFSTFTEMCLIDPEWRDADSISIGYFLASLLNEEIIDRTEELTWIRLPHYKGDVLNGRIYGQHNSLTRRAQHHLYTGTGQVNVDLKGSYALALKKRLSPEHAAIVDGAMTKKDAAAVTLEGKLRKLVHNMQHFGADMPKDSLGLLFVNDRLAIDDEINVKGYGGKKTRAAREVFDSLHDQYVPTDLTRFARTEKELKGWSYVIATEYHDIITNSYVAGFYGVYHQATLTKIFNCYDRCLPEIQAYEEVMAIAFQEFDHLPKRLNEELESQGVSKKDTKMYRIREYFEQHEQAIITQLAEGTTANNHDGAIVTQEYWDANHKALIEMQIVEKSYI